MATPKKTAKSAIKPRRLSTASSVTEDPELEDAEVVTEEDEDETVEPEEEQVEVIQPTQTTKSTKKSRKLTVVALPVREISEKPDKIIITFSKDADIEMFQQAQRLSRVSSNQELALLAIQTLLQMKEAERDGKLWVEVDRNDVHALEEFFEQ